jgi:hypothetical protein
MAFESCLPQLSRRRISNRYVLMNSRLTPLFFTICISALGAPTSAFGQGDTAKAVDRCETAVAETVKRMRGKAAQELQFIGTKRKLLPAEEDETGVRGEGRYSSKGGGLTSFSYSCAYNFKTGATSGVMFRETGSGRATAESSWNPDLTNVSPDACETATAADLKQKYPRVARIAFGSDSRQLRPGIDDHTNLEGQGAVQRAPGMQLTPFNYRCEFARNGRIVSVQTSN